MSAAAASMFAVTMLSIADIPPPLSRCTEKRFEQLVDHFDGAAALHWSQRYFICEPSWWRAPNGPIYFYSGNESPVEEYINNTGLMWENAEADGALLVFAEHRFFKPTAHLYAMTENQAEPNVSGLMLAPEAVVWRIVRVVMLKRCDPDTGPSHVAARRDAALRFLASPDLCHYSKTCIIRTLVIRT